MEDIRDGILGEVTDEDDPATLRRLGEREQLQQDYRDCFGTTSGKRVLASLVDATVMSHDLGGDPIEVAFNAGRRNVVLSILRTLGAGRAKPSILEAFHHVG